MHLGGENIVKLIYNDGVNLGKLNSKQYQT